MRARARGSSKEFGQNVENADGGSQLGQSGPQIVHAIAALRREVREASEERQSGQVLAPFLFGFGAGLGLGLGLLAFAIARAVK